MAVYPTDKSSPGTWGAECSAYHAVSTDLATGKIKDGAVQVSSAAPTVDAGVANKKYVDDGGEKSVNGTPTQVFTKYITGTLASAATDTIAHGVPNGLTGILFIGCSVFQDGDNRYIACEAFREEQAANEWSLFWDATNLYFTVLGSQVQGNGYRIKIDYKL